MRSCCPTRLTPQCNNPDTHEPKLARAKRLVPEWTTYDEEVASVARKAQSTAEDSKVFAADASALQQAQLQQTEYVEEGTGATAADVAPAESPREHTEL